MSMIAAGGSGINPVYPWASMPAAGIIGRQAFCSNFGVKGNMLQDDGTRWKPLNGQALLASRDVLSGNINNVETIVFQHQLPAAFWQISDRLRLVMTHGKSGTTDNMTTKLRLGTAGTTSDTQLFSWTFLNSGNRSSATMFDLRLETATTVQQLNNTGGTFAGVGYSNIGAGVVAGPVTISNVSNSLFFSVSITSAGATDTSYMQEAQLWYLSKAN